MGCTCFSISTPTLYINKLLNFQGLRSPKEPLIHQQLRFSTRARRASPPSISTRTTPDLPSITHPSSILQTKSHQLAFPSSSNSSQPLLPPKNVINPLLRPLKILQRHHLHQFPPLLPPCPLLKPPNTHATRPPSTQQIALLLLGRIKR